jgi:hypothetical protein
MELLATVLWLYSDNPNIKNDYNDAIAGFSKWNERKKQNFKPEHIKIAWDRLLKQQWI